MAEEEKPFKESEEVFYRNGFEGPYTVEEQYFNPIRRGSGWVAKIKHSETGEWRLTPIEHLDRSGLDGYPESAEECPNCGERSMVTFTSRRTQLYKKEACVREECSYRSSESMMST